MNGPLRVHPTNPRYFTDDDGEPIILVGSHTFLVQQDHSAETTFDYDAWVAFLVSHNHNYQRYWNLDRSTIDLSSTSTVGSGYLTPMPWNRTGPGNSADAGGLKFDLSSFNQDYFDRLRLRVSGAGSSGIYCQIMLWDAIWVLNGQADSWNFHPYNPNNNINGYAMTRTQCYTMASTGWVALMEAYVRKVIDTVNDLDNVLYEIANEANPASSGFQYHMIDYIHTYEATKPKQHPVIMGGFDVNIEDDEGNEILLGSNADAVSILGRDVGVGAPSAWNESKVSLYDSDHIWGFPVAGDNRAWVWQSTMRGHNPNYLDTYTLGSNPPPDSGIRTTLGAVRRVLQNVELANMIPSGALTSTQFALVNRDQEYLVYQSSASSFTVNLPNGTFKYQWFDSFNGQRIGFGLVNTVSGDNTFTVPVSSGKLLHLKRYDPNSKLKLININKISNLAKLSMPF